VAAPLIQSPARRLSLDLGLAIYREAATTFAVISSPPAYQLASATALATFPHATTTPELPHGVGLGGA
jgi:hypothetical protein